MSADNNSVEFYNIKVESSRLLFSFDVGTTVSCTLLLREDKSYGGDCRDAEGGNGVIVMIPPKAEFYAQPEALGEGQSHKTVSY